MSSNLHDSPTSSCYLEEETEATTDTGPLYPSLSSELQFIQQESFCFELFSACVSSF